MSLINKMLNELEKNKKGEEPARTEILSSIGPIIKKYTLIPKKKILIGLLISIALISICFLYTYKATSKRIKPKPIKITPIVNTKSLTPVAQPITPPKPIAAIDSTVKLKNILLRPINDKTVIDFVLSAPTLYYLEHSTDHQHLFITLSNTGLLGNLPVALENSFVLALNTKQNGTSTVCTLTLLPDTKIDEVQLLTMPQPQLHLELSNPQLTSSKMSKTPIPASAEQQLEQRYQQVQRLLSQNDTKEAITQLHWFVADFPNHLQARETLVALLIKEKDLQRADNVLMVGLNKKPNYAPFIKLKTHILTEQGKINMAVDLLQKHSSLFTTEDTEYLALLAVLYQQQEQFIKAAKLYNQLTKIQPQKPTWWIGLGMSLESAGKKNAAKEAYRRAYGSSEITPDLAAFLTDKIKR